MNECIDGNNPKYNYFRHEQTRFVVRLKHTNFPMFQPRNWYKISQKDYERDECQNQAQVLINKIIEFFDV